MSETCTFTAPNSVGNLLLAVMLSFTGTVAAPTDTAGNTYHLAHFQPDGGTTDGNLYIYYVWNCKAAIAGNVVTATAAGGNVDDFKVAEFNGVQNTSDPLSVHSGFSLNAPGSPSTIVTPTAPGSLIIGWSTSDHGQTVAGAGMILISNADTDVFEYVVLGAPYTFTVSSGPPDALSSLIAAAVFLPQTTAVGAFLGGVIG